MQGCTVHAFEPLELNADHLEMTMRSNDLHERVHLHRLAAAQTPRNVSLRWSFKETGLTHVISPGEIWGNSSNRYVAGARRSVGMYWHEQKDVPARRIDQVLSSLSNVTNIAWMKVDVEVRSHATELESRRLNLFLRAHSAGALLIVRFYILRFYICKRADPSCWTPHAMRRATSSKPSVARVGC